MSGTRPVRAPRYAGELKVDDYVHDPLVPMRVLALQSAEPGIIRLVGRIESGTTMRVQHPADLLLDVTRLVEDVDAGRARLMIVRGA